MSQIEGRKRISNSVEEQTVPQSVGVDLVDHKANGALSTAIYPGALSRLIDDTVPGVTYIGEVAPGFIQQTAEPIWRIQQIDNNSSPKKTSWASLAATATEPEKYATFEHVWDDRASLTYM